jgi:hypothetical protein
MNEGNKNKGKIFHIGEVAHVKDSTFQIRHIDYCTGIMVMKLMRGTDSKNDY